MYKIFFIIALFLSQILNATIFEEKRWDNGETFLTFLEKNKLPLNLYYESDKETQELCAEIVAGVDYQTLKSQDGTIEQILIPIGEELQLHIAKMDEKYILKMTPISYQELGEQVSINIESSPYQDIVKATGNFLLANEFVNSFKGGVNFRRDLQPGNKLVVFYKHKVRLGKQYGSPILEVAMIESKNKKHYIFMHENGKYYDELATQLESFLLAKPLNYTRISSEFTLKRFHPVLKIYRAHLGIDYAAPVGTPIKSAGDGIISFAGVKGGYGKTITVRHSDGYETLYAHLNGFARGIIMGKKILKNQLIGYVGNTGLSSGPHLHFGLYKNQKAINPANVVNIAKSELEGAEKKQFLANVDMKKKRVEEVMLSLKTPIKIEKFDHYVSLYEKNNNSFKN